MKVPYSWLKEFVDLDVTPLELADKLVSIGFEIEEIINLRDSIKNVVAGKITDMERHPNSDHLWVCRVDVKKAIIQIVTGAQNVNLGDIVPVAINGAVLPSGKVIYSGELRGVKSEGMMCSGEELGLTEEDYKGAGVYGILILNTNTEIGADINDIIGNTETVFDIAITANRPDCNSIMGIAREVAAVFNKKINMPRLTYKTTEINCESFVAVENQNFNLCPRYMAAVVTDVVETQSPKIIRDRLKAVGIRPINNLVDVTNYVLTEIGQPMHAFDLNNLSQHKIVIRNAMEGENITALDGKNYNLRSHQLAICDAEKPIAVAGVMGGEYSSICANTQTVVLESARFEYSSICANTQTVVLESARFARDSIRHTARELNLHSDSSARYEKGIDFYSQEIGLNRALALFDEYGWGKITSGKIDLCAKRSDNRKLIYDFNDVNVILGIKVPKEVIISILNALELTTTYEGNVLTTAIPEFREDIVGINDIAEEVVRFYGYDELEPRLISNKRGGKTAAQERIDKLKNIMVGYGCLETVTYSFISPKAFDMLRLAADDNLRKAVEISNPLGSDFSVMRTTLSYSLLKLIATNYMRGNKNGRLFEIANVYLPKTLPLTELPEENQHLIIGCYGVGEDFYHIKSFIEDISAVYGFNFEFKSGELAFMHPGRTAFVYSCGKKIGYVGEVHPNVTRSFGIDCRVYLAEIDADFIAHNGIDIKPYQAISKFQSSERDLALIAPIDTEVGTILATIRNASGDILEKTEVFDIYTGGQVPKGQKSVAVRLTLRSSERTLTDNEVNFEIEKILRALKNKDVFLR